MMPNCWLTLSRPRVRPRREGMPNKFFQFHDLWFLLLLALLLLVPILRGKKSGGSIAYPSLALFQGMGRSFKERFEFLLPLLKGLALALFIVALARPQWGNKTTET